MSPEHVLLCYRASRRGDAALLGAVELANAAGAKLTVLLPMTQAARGPRCCGIQDSKWRELVGDALDDELTHAAALVNGAAGHVTFAQAEGLSIQDAVSAYARSHGCDLIAIPTAGSRLGGDFGRRNERTLARTAPCPVVRLPSGTGASSGLMSGSAEPVDEDLVVQHGQRVAAAGNDDQVGVGESLRRVCRDDR